MEKSNPTFYKPHVRLEYDLVSDPPKLICCVAIWVPANEELTAPNPDPGLLDETIIRYTVNSSPDVPIANDHWEHFTFTWPWTDYRKEKRITNTVGHRASTTNSSDRAEPCSE